MDFEGNKQRIIESIKKCIDEEASIRLGPELEISGYGCDDHFLENDTVTHTWEIIWDLIEEWYSDNLVLVLWAAIIWNWTLYNCSVWIHKRQILLIRPKMYLADDWSYREGRWFSWWWIWYKLFDFILPQFIQNITKQKVTKIWVWTISFIDCICWVEICEEWWCSKNPAVDQCLAWAEIIFNHSGSCCNPGKQKTRMDLMQTSTKKNWWCYVYSNLIGCDWWRLYFDWWSFACLNWELICEWPRAELIDYHVQFPIINMEDIQKHRQGNRSRGNL